MPGRSADWMRQALRDLDHARHAREAGDHEWACFASHQAAEKALKAVHQARGEEAWGHTVTVLLAGCMGGPDLDALLAKAKALDKHYIPARYPNGFESGAPMDFYTSEDAGKAIEDAEGIVTRCESLLR